MICGTEDINAGATVYRGFPEINAFAEAWLAMESGPEPTYRFTMSINPV